MSNIITTHQQRLVNASEKETLQSIANTSNRSAGVMANNILCFHYGICKDYPPILPFLTNQRKVQSKQSSTEESLKVYPNPANDFVVFDYSKIDVSGSTYIEITDVTGKVLATLDIANKKEMAMWETRTISNGVYLYKLIREGFPTLNGKFVVQH